MKRLFAAFLLVILFTTSAYSAWLPGYIFRKPLTVDHTKVATGNHFYVILTDANFDFTDWDTHLGGYIEFTEDDGSTKIPWCVETWDQANHYAKIALMPTSVSEETDETFYMYYGFYYTYSLNLGAPDFPEYVNSIFAFSNTNGWTDHASNPLLSPEGDEDILFPVSVWLDGTDDYSMAYAAHLDASNLRVLPLAYSSTGTAWTKAGTIIDINGETGTWDEAIRNGVYWKEGETWHIIYGGADHPDQYPGNLGYAYSTSGLEGTWMKPSSSPVVTGAATWEKTKGGEANIEITAPIVKVGSTYYMFYTTYSCTPERAIGIATATDPAGPWTKNANNPIFDNGRFCNMVWYNDETELYYTLVTHYTDEAGCNYSEFELYSCPTITFYEADRTFMGIAHAVGATGTSYEHDQDVPLLLTNDVQRASLEATNGEVWVYFSGEDSDSIFTGNLMTCNMRLATIPPKNKGYDIVGKNRNLLGAEKLSSSWKNYDYLLAFDGTDDFLRMPIDFISVYNTSTAFYQSFIVEMNTGGATQPIFWRPSPWPADGDCLLQLKVDHPLLSSGNTYDGDHYTSATGYDVAANAAFYSSFVVRPTSSVSTTQCIFSNRDAGTASANINLSIVSSQFYGAIRDDSGTQSVAASAGPTLNVNQIYYVGVGKDTSGNCYLVVDGKKYLASETKVTGTINPDQASMYYGVHKYGATETQFFTGNIAVIEHITSWPSDEDLTSKNTAAKATVDMRFHAYITDDSVTSVNGRFGPSLSNNTIYIVGVGRTTAGTVYGVVNATKYQVGTGLTNSIAFEDRNIYIGRDGSTGTNYFKGYIGGWENYTKFPSDDELTHFYNSLTNGLLTYGTALEGGFLLNDISIYRTGSWNGISTTNLKSWNGVNIQ